MTSSLQSIEGLLYYSYMHENSDLNENNGLLEPFTVDLDKDSMEKINKFQLDRLNSVLTTVLMEEHLCDQISSEVVAEFGFTGSRLEVIKKLENLIEYRRTNPYTEDDRDLLRKELNNLLIHKKEIQHNPIVSAIRNLNVKCWTEYSDETCNKIARLKEQLALNHKNRHRTRECICFFN